jgi:predicted dehydrogenase
MSTPIRVGVIGASPTRGWALGSHLPPLVALEGFELIAVATTRTDTARETAREFGVPLAFGDAAELIAHPDVDLVTVSVKVPYHHDLVHAALEAGKRVFCEWPLGANTTQATDLLTLARTRGLRHVIGLQGRRSPLVNYVRDLASQGYLGELLYAALSIEMEGPGKTITQDRIWATDKANGVGTLAIIGGHNLDVLRYIIGDISELQATVAVRWPEATVVETGAPIDVTSPDVVLVQGRAAGGAFISVAIQAGLPKGLGATLELHGSEGILVVRGDRSLHLSDALLALSGSTGGAPVEPLEIPASYRTVPDLVPDTAARNVAGLYLALGAAIEGDSDPEAFEPSFATAVELHRFLDAIDEASNSGVRHRLD